jgi:integrase/recombinase XerD
MKCLILKTDSYKYLEQSFKQWLAVLGYAPTSVYGMPLRLREFFHWLEQQDVTQLKDITARHITQYYSYIKQRANTRQGGGLSPSYINKHKQVIDLFSQYVRQSGRYEMPYVQLENQRGEKENLNVLSVGEIKQLYHATHSGDTLYHAQEIGMRDRAMLSVLYGCGLRRSEAKNLDIDDINLDTKTLHVRKAKGNKARLVPLHSSNVRHLENYLYNARPVLLDKQNKKGKPESAFFISVRSKRLSDMTMLYCLHKLIKKTENPVLIEKAPSLHTLRHSIATHLLDKGMKLEAISKFLGHSSLESTQIYTHLTDEQGIIIG